MSVPARAARASSRRVRLRCARGTRKLAVVPQYSIAIHVYGVYPRQRRRRLRKESCAHASSSRRDCRLASQPRKAFRSIVSPRVSCHDYSTLGGRTQMRLRSLHSVREWRLAACRLCPSAGCPTIQPCRRAPRRGDPGPRRSEAGDRQLRRLRLYRQLAASVRSTRRPATCSRARVCSSRVATTQLRSVARRGRGRRRPRPAKPDPHATGTHRA